MTAATRRFDILRQLARAADGLRVMEIRGLGASTAGLYLREMTTEGLVDAVPIRRTERTSQRPVVRYAINAQGRAVLAGEMARETFA